MFPKKKTTLAVSLLVVIGLVFLGLVVTSFVFYNISVQRNSKDFLEKSPDLGQTPSTQASTPKVSGADWVEAQRSETWQLTTQDGLNLVATWIPAAEPTSRTVILAHGYSSQGKGMGDFARFYQEKFRYNVLLPDARGHGRSSGDYIGFGWPDRKDYLQWIERVIAKTGDQAQVVLHGVSMGAATVMMVSGEELPSHVKAIVEDCGYTSVYDQLAYQLDRMYRLPAVPFVPATSLLTRFRAGYGFSEASALDQVKKDKVPMLFIHGDADTFVPTAMVYRVFAACTSEKELYVVPGAGHGEAWATDKSAYEAKVQGFLSRFVH